MRVTKNNILPQNFFFNIFWKLEACGKTLLADKSLLIRQKLVEIARIEKFRWDIFGDFGDVEYLNLSDTARLLEFRP